jgi:hypothetical protein
MKQLNLNKAAEQIQNIIKENISAINKITSSKYFISYCNIKLEFFLIDKNNIQVDIVNFYTF